MDEIVAVQREREKIYGNMHAVWTVTKIVQNGEDIESTIEFWSREHQYYRFDVINTSDSSSSNKITRMIVRPEGYARIFANSREDPGAIFRFGAAEEGMNWVRAAKWYCQANKVSHDFIHETITDWLNGKEFYKTFHVKKEGDSVFIEGFVDVESATNSETFELSSSGYRFLQSQTRVDNKDDGTWYESKYAKVYDNQQTDIPIASSASTVESNGSMKSLNYELKEFQLTPAPLEVFFVAELAPLDARPAGIVWFRRLLVAGVGFACFAVYFFHRKRVNRT
ncbi:hypothetical protein [Planctomycetes bacterium CA13]